MTWGTGTWGTGVWGSGLWEGMAEDAVSPSVPGTALLTRDTPVETLAPVDRRMKGQPS